MTAQEIQELLARQRAFFQSGRTLALDFRLAQLAKLYQAVQKYESEINAALLHDLGKSFFEGFMCDSGLVLGEISFMRKHLKKFAKPCRVRTPLAQFAAKSFITPDPYGNILIMSPWNYPILLTLEPLVDAIAAGNTAILKPSAYAPASSEILQKIVSECFSPEYVAVVTGGRAENSALLGQKFDLIFFTGSQNVGREVLRQAAENLTPVILELGGKSPCIVEESADIALAAKRIVFGKFLNCGQTCVAPDYILCQQSIKDELVRELIKQIKLQFGEEPLKNPAYGKIICRCETVSEGEILDALRRNPKATDIDGVKRRTRSGMGRCQGGFCMPYVMRLIEKETGKPMTEITKKGGKSNTVTGRL